jgi:hypothetical protein
MRISKTKKKTRFRFDAAPDHEVTALKEQINSGESVSTTNQHRKALEKQDDGLISSHRRDARSFQDVRWSLDVVFCERHAS